MLRTHLRSSFLIILSLILSCSTSDKDKKIISQEKDFLPGVKIIYSANLNGEIEPCGCRSTPIGGLSRRWNWQEQKVPQVGSQKNSNDEKLSFDSGDLFYPSSPVPPFLEKQWNLQAETLVEAYNQLQIDAFVPGELDFAAGFMQFEKLKSKAKFEFVCANLYLKAKGFASSKSDTIDSSKTYLNPYILLKKGGKKVAVFGLYDESLPLPDELQAKNHLDIAKTLVHSLKGKAQVIIAVTHLGLEKDIELVKQVSGIDAIFGAHSQSFLIVPQKVNDTLIFQTSLRGQHLGLFSEGKNHLYQIDDRFESESNKKNKMDVLVQQAKLSIAKSNEELEAELGIKSDDKMLSTVTDHKNFIYQDRLVQSYQTFPKCIQCHIPQYDFYKNTAHAHAYDTLVKVKQNKNLDCLKCHTLGLNEVSGYKHVKKLVYNAQEKIVSAEPFAQSLPRLTSQDVAKYSKVFINVQCEHCHGKAGNHPFESKLVKTPNKEICLKCHTFDRAPKWYSNGKPNESLIKEKMKTIACPAFTKE